MESLSKSQENLFVVSTRKYIFMSFSLGDILLSSKIQTSIVLPVLSVVPLETFITHLLLRIATVHSF